MQSLSRSLTNSQAQVYEEDNYTNLAGIPYLASTPQLVGAGYNATLDGYDPVGNLVRTVDAAAASRGRSITSSGA